MNFLKLRKTFTVVEVRNEQIVNVVKFTVCTKDTTGYRCNRI